MIFPFKGLIIWSLSFLYASKVNGLDDQHEECHRDAYADDQKYPTYVSKLDSVLFVFFLRAFYLRCPVFWLQFVQIVFIRHLHKPANFKEVNFIFLSNKFLIHNYPLFSTCNSGDPFWMPNAIGLFENSAPSVSMPQFVKIMF